MVSLSKKSFSGVEFYDENMKIKDFTRMIWKGFKKIFWLIFLSGLFTFLFSSSFVNFQHLGILFLSDFEHTDFNTDFQDNFKTNKEYSSEKNLKLITSIKNNYNQANNARTKLVTPDFVKVQCSIDNPYSTYDDCNGYTISAGSIKQLLFNLSIEDTPKENHEFCLVTELQRKRWGLFKNDKKDCIYVTISSD